MTIHTRNGRPMQADVHHAKAERVWGEFAQLIGEGMTIVKALTVIDGGKGRTPAAYERRRQRNPQWAATIDTLRQAAREARKDAAWDGSFADFRHRYFGMDSPPFHLQITSVLERVKPGYIVLVLCPPEHGKTSLLEDYVGYKLAVDPSYRVTIVSEGQPHARKFIRRVKNRMEPDGPAPAYVARFGPFAPQTGTERKMAQPWGADFFDVHKKGKFDERDYSCQAVGVGSAVAGSRTDLLVMDDIQSMRSLSQTDKILDFIRTDFLSRPGSGAPTVIIGTRVGEDDVYQRFLDEGMIDELIQFPAHDYQDHWPPPDRGAKAKDNPKNLAGEQVRFLWPERYDRKDYLIMRLNVGESAWERNYMQRPRRAGDSTFTDPMIDEVCQPLRSVISDPPPGVTNIVVGLDPGFGLNALMAAGMTSRKLYPLTWRVDAGLTNNQQIFGLIEDYCIQYRHPGRCTVTDLMIEDKAYQHGLLADEGLLDLRRAYGFRVSGHQTGINKYDPDIGIPAMARSFLRGEIELPDANDPPTRAAMALLRAELVSWRPYKRGNRLRQDLVMALWFCWLRWRQIKETIEHSSTDIEIGGMPFPATPMSVLTGVGLVA